MYGTTPYAEPRLTSLDTPDTFVVVDVREIVEILNQFVDSIYPATFIDEILRQLIDYCDADFSIYMTHVRSLAERLGNFQAWKAEQIAVLSEALHDCGMHFYGQCKELRLFGPGARPSGFHFCLEVRNGDSVVLKYFTP